MIAVDSSSLIAFLACDSGSDVNAIEDALNAQALILPPVVLTEILSDPKLPKQADTLIAQSCLDYDTPLITRDRDFRHFEKFAQLKVIW
ncbi:MAG: hypothetical protein ACM3SR_00715 [Ignavibacteriales bacterium]